MIDDMKIDRMFLNEEMGISDEVTRETKRILKTIDKAYREIIAGNTDKGKIYFLKDYLGAGYTGWGNSSLIFGDDTAHFSLGDIPVMWRSFRFIDVNTYYNYKMLMEDERYGLPSIRNCCIWGNNVRICITDVRLCVPEANTNSYGVQTKIVPNAADSIQHELVHAYEYLMSNKHLASHDETYRTNTNDVFREHDDQVLNWSFYYCLPEERRTFVNGTYSRIMNRESGAVFNVCRSNLWRGMVILKDAIDILPEIMEDDEKSKLFIKKYKMTPYKARKCFDAALWELKDEFGKILVICKEKGKISDDEIAKINWNLIIPKKYRLVV